MARPRTIYRTKSGSYSGTARTKKTRRGKAMPRRKGSGGRMTKAEHRQFNTLKHRQRMGAHHRRKGR